MPSRPPNFLLIFTDDHGYGYVSTYHKSDVHTPHIDRLAAEGMLFTAMRANCTVCAPSRAALLTGRYADRVGVPGVIRTHPEDSWGWRLCPHFDVRPASFPLPVEAEFGEFGAEFFQVPNEKMMIRADGGKEPPIGAECGLDREMEPNRE
jgi:hypothetical protein